MSYRTSRKPPRKPISKENPEQIWVTDRASGQLTPIDPAMFPAALKPAIWFENAYWEHSGYLTREQVMQYFNREELDKDLAYRMGKYILVFSQNLASANWLFADTPQDKQAYLALMAPCIRRLKAVLRSKPFNHSSIAQMISICMNYAIDPF